MSTENYEQKQKLRLKTYTQSIPNKPCTNCGAMMKPDDVLCVKCGYNTQTGRIAPAHIAKHRKPLPIARTCYNLFLVALIGGFIFAGTYLFLSLVALDTDAPKIKPGHSVRLPLADGTKIQGLIEAIRPGELVIVSIPQKTNVISLTSLHPLARVRCDPTFKAGYLLGETRKILTFAYGNPISGLSTFRSTLRDATAASKPPFPITEDQLQGWIDEQAKLELSTTASAKPLEPGEKIEIRRVNGQIISGKLVSLTNHTLAIDGYTGRTEIPFQELDNDLRARVDQHWRTDLARLRAILLVRNAVKEQGGEIPPAPVTEASLPTALKTGNPAALAVLAKKLLDQRLYAEAAAYAEVASTLEDPLGLYIMGHLAANGLGTARDWNRAQVLLQTAAARGNEEAKSFNKFIEDRSRICATCNGLKRIKCTDCGGFGSLQTGTGTRADCTTCRGIGFTSCEPCRGSGVNPTKK